MGAGLRAMGKSMGNPPDPKVARATSLPDLTVGQEDVSLLGPHREGEEP